MRLALVLAGGVLLGAAPAASAQTPSQPVVATTTYAYGSHFPEMFAGAAFAMPRKEFLDLLSAKNISWVGAAGDKVIVVATPKGPFTNAIFFFNSNAGEILSEIELRFPDEDAARAYMVQHYSPRNAEGDFVVHDGVSYYRAKAWQFQAKVFLVATMVNTRWANQ